MADGHLAYSLVYILVMLLNAAISIQPSDEVIAVKLHQTSASEQANAAREVLRRLLPGKADSFHFAVDLDLGPVDKDTFEIKGSNGTVFVTGNTGYAVTFGLQYYLKKYCGCHISWTGNQLRLPENLPMPDPKKKTSNDKYRYYMNTCTFSYSTVWWDWKRWEREIDWMALNGINLPLAFTGQEMIFKKVFASFNFTASDMDEYFTGSAFLAWNRMGNVQAWGGPLSTSWLDEQSQLQHRILRRMRSLGMTPVLPAFSGRVPPSIKRIYPNASVTYSSAKWGHFDRPYGPVAFLEPTGSLFNAIGEKFMQMYIEEFGTNNIYNIDLFNELVPSSGASSYLASVAKSVYQTLTNVDHEAKWLMQGWMFFHNQSFWTEERAEALLTAVPQGRMIVLDLQSELYPQYERLNSYFGQPFIWCMLHNYGGVSGLYGSLPKINEKPFVARKTPGYTMIGTGITPEGIETNDVVYEMMNEIAWRTNSTNITNWISSYAKKRYGWTCREVRTAWIALSRSVYNATAPFRNHGGYILTTRPSLKLKPYVWYNISDVFSAWKLFGLASENVALQNSSLFRHDFVDLTRQALQIIFDLLYQRLCEAFAVKNISAFRNASYAILELYSDMEDILSSDGHFLLGTWLEDATRKATTLSEKWQYNFNARNQITLWGPTGQILDYANKQWSGIIKDYFRKRWQLFLGMLEVCLLEKRHFNQTEYNEKVLQHVEIPFGRSNKQYPGEPKGDSIKLAQQLLKKYSVVRNYLRKIGYKDSARGHQDLPEVKN